MRESEGFRETIADIRGFFGMEVQTLTVDQVAKYLNCNRGTVTRLIEKKRLQAADIGSGKYGVYRISIQALARFMTTKR